MLLGRLALCALVCAAAPSLAETAAEARAARPELFDPETGLRVARYRGPTPEDAPGATVADRAGLLAAVARGAALIDVAMDDRGVWFGPEEGWVGARPRATIPGATWLPAVGEGRLEPEIEAYFRDALAALSPDRARPVALFCFADCWMSWNAALRLVAWGWRDVLWYPLGTDGWTEAGGRLAAVAPFRPRPGARP